MRKLYFLLCLFGLHSAFAQDSLFIRSHIEALCSDSFAGRGYVDSGVQRASTYLVNEFKNLGLQPVKDNSFTQVYSFSVNTFPGVISLWYKNKKMNPGTDFLIDASSRGTSQITLRTKVIYLNDIDSKEKWQSLLSACNDKNKAYVLTDIDTLQHRLGLNPREIAQDLPKGVFILPKKSKPLWWPSTSLNQATIVYWFDTLQTIKNNAPIQIKIDQQFVENMVCENVAGEIMGSVDSYIVMTAHYDHLGKMGKATIFPGASDNASGTAMMLSLAQYFAQHPQRYKILFIAFSGEEAGLLGSDYFVHHPLIDMKKIRLLINVDIMGDASAGISVVNATNHTYEFNLLKKLNPVVAIQHGDSSFALKEIRERADAPISDHYPFSQAGVAALFIYSLGGKGFYHDTWDRPETLSLKNVMTVRKMLIDFVEELQ